MRKVRTSLARDLRPEQRMEASGGYNAPRTREHGVARLVSQLTNPAFVALPTFLAVALRTAPAIPSGLLWWLVTSLGISIAPLLHVYVGVRAGRYRDHHLNLRQERLIPLVVSIVSASSALALLLISHASLALL